MYGKVPFAKEFLFVPSAKGTEPPATTNAPKFKKFLESMGAAEFVVKLHERSADGFYDLTGLDDLLVLSDPTATDLSDFGLHRLRALTQELSKDVDEDSTSTYILDICTSSMGSLTTGTLLDEIEEAMMGNLNKSLGVETHLIYMSQADADKYAVSHHYESRGVPPSDELMIPSLNNDCRPSNGCGFTMHGTRCTLTSR